MTKLTFKEERRQPFLDNTSFSNTMNAYEDDFAIIEQDLSDTSETASGRAELYGIRAQRYWSRFQLQYTYGANLGNLASSLTQVVEAYEDSIAAMAEVPDDEYQPPFLLDETIDNYVDYVNLLSAAILLHREELVPRICALNEDTDYDKSDAVIEKLFSFFLSDRPEPNELYWKAHALLLTAIGQSSHIERQRDMEKYVKGWYKSMKGVAHFWGKHEQITPEYSPYDGYWAMCAAAFTYLYDINDSTYRDEMVYPKDLVDYARSMPRDPKGVNIG